MWDILYFVLCKYRILDIVSQTLHIVEKFSEIQCCYFGSEKELTSLMHDILNTLLPWIITSPAQQTCTLPAG